jgi:hypothetical protein
MAKYSDKFKDPRWQKKRLEILERDEWMCCFCSCTEKTLHVHHRWYEKDTDPWDYPNKCLVTLCEECHEIETSDLKEAYLDLKRVTSHTLYAEEIFHLCEAIGDVGEENLTIEEMAIYLAMIKQPRALIRVWREEPEAQLFVTICLSRRKEAKTWQGSDQQNSGTPATGIGR